MVWNDPPKLINKSLKKGKLLTPEMIAKDSEDSHQQALFAWAASMCGQYPQLKWLHAIPNGGQRHIAEATKMVAAGLRKGVLDIFLPWPRARFNYEYHGLYIELKIEKRRHTKDGGLTAEQLEFIPYARNAGYYCAVCYNWQEARDVIVMYLEGKL